MIIMVGMVDANGFGVPFKLCRPKVSVNAIAVGIMTAAANASVRIFTFTAIYSQNFIITPPKKKMYPPYLSAAVRGGSIHWLLNS